jgi:tetratricopeptide (TPR) repeat protein
MARYYPVAYIWATYEDLIGEWSQFYLFVAAFVFSIRVAVSGSQYRLFFALLAAACFYVFMEEISWGQRIIGFASPEVFERHNLQREVNLHNFLVGPYDTLIKDVIEYCLAAALVLYGLGYPLALRVGWGVARLAQRLGIAPPPLYLWPYFVIAALLELRLFRFSEAEIAEVLIGLALTIMAAHYSVEQRTQREAEREASTRSATARRLATITGVVSVSVLILAAVTTYGVYAMPHMAESTQIRLENGLNKLVRRYRGYERWELAARLDQHLHADRPKRTDILRRLADTYEKMGDDARFREYNAKALALELAAYQRTPNNVPLNLSLVRTYRQIGQEEKAEEHLQRALHVASARVRRNPTSADGAYWLGKTHMLLGDYASAEEQFARAFELSPTTRFRRALHNARRTDPEHETDP